MKRKTIYWIAGVLVVLIGAGAWVALAANKRSPAKTASASNAGLDIQVSYCAPYKKGRLIFGEEKDHALQPYGKYWRLGANAATQITFNKNVKFAGQPLAAGTYRMYAVPGAQTWQVCLNTQLDKWGFSEPDYSKDVLKVEVPVSTTPEVEQFVITFANDTTAVVMDFAWDKSLVRIPIAAQ